MSSFSTTRATMARTAFVPSTSFVCPSNCGSASRTVTTAVRPARTSSFSSLSVPTLRRRALSSSWRRSTFTRAWSNPARWVPPFGVAMMLTNDETFESYPVPHRTATSTPHSRSTSVGVMCPLLSSTGTVSVNVPLPWRRQTSVTGASGARYSQNSEIPPWWRKTSSIGSGRALVADEERQTRHEERGLPRPGKQPLHIEVGIAEEDLPVGPVPHPRAGDAAPDAADHLELTDVDVGGEGVLGVLGAASASDVREGPGLAPSEAHRIGLAAAVDLDVEPGGQCVDDRGAHAVQTAGCRVRAATELPAGVQPGVDELDAGQPGARFDVDGDAAAVVPDLDRPVPQEHDLDPVTVAAQGLVDGVVDDLPQAVHEAPGVGGADVHAGALADRLEALEDLEVVGGVLGRGLARRGLLRSGRRHAMQASRRAGRTPAGAPSELGGAGPAHDGDPAPTVPGVTERSRSGHDADHSASPCTGGSIRRA